jgi:hypothetical protein
MCLVDFLKQVVDISVQGWRKENFDREVDAKPNIQKYFILNIYCSVNVSYCIYYTFYNVK